MRRVPVSYIELHTRRGRLSRALFEPILYLFFLACFVVMLQLLPTLRSYGERAAVETDLDSLFAKGSDNGAITTRGYGPRGLGISQPGLCPDVALWEDAGALVNTEAIVGETQKAWQWATQVSRTFHRPTRCKGCSFDDLRLHDKYILYSAWMTLALVDGVPRNELGDTEVTFGIRMHEALGFDFTQYMEDLTSSSANDSWAFSNVHPLTNWGAVDRVTASERSWDFMESYGFSLGGSRGVQKQVELLCANITLSNATSNACEIARRRSTEYHNMNDMCSPIAPEVMGYATMALANDTRCMTATSVGQSTSGGLDECPVRIALTWSMLLREEPRGNVASGIVRGGDTGNTMPSVDDIRAAGGSTDSLWVLTTFDGSESTVSYTFLPVDLYPGSQGVALLVFQVVFLVFTLFFMLYPVFGRLVQIERGMRPTVPSVWWRLPATLGRAFARKWFWFDLLTLAMMLTTIILYGVFVDRHKALSASCSDCLNLDAEVPMGAEEWDDITKYCCGQTTLETCETFDVVQTPFCCATAYGNCFKVCSDEEVVDVAVQKYAPTTERAFMREAILALALNGEEAYLWSGEPWLTERPVDETPSPHGPPFVPPSVDPDRSCVQGAYEQLPNGRAAHEVVQNVTWCGTTTEHGGSGDGCLCDPAICNIHGNCCADVHELCVNNATYTSPRLPEGWHNVSWDKYHQALLTNYRLSAPIGNDVSSALIDLQENEVDHGLNFSAAQTPQEICEQLLSPNATSAITDNASAENTSVADVIHERWLRVVQEQAERLTKPYESYTSTFQRASSAEENFVIALAFCAILLFSRTLRYAHIDVRMSLILRTLKVAAGTICFFLASGSLLFMGYVFFAQIYNGFILLQGYTTFFQAFTNTFNLLFDPFPGEDFPSASSWPFWIWYFFFMTLITTIGLNLVIAILVSAFELVRDFAAVRERGQHTIGSAFAEWRELQRATRLKNGEPDMAAVYAFYSKREPWEVESAAVRVQSRWRGFHDREWLRGRGVEPLPPAAAKPARGGAGDGGARLRERRPAASTPVRMLSRHPAATARLLADQQMGDESGGSGDEGADEMPPLADVGPAAMLSALAGMQHTLRDIAERTRRLEEQMLGPTEGVRVER